MDYINQLLKAFGLPTVPLLIAGFSGSMASLVYEEKMTFTQMVVRVLLGIVTSAFLTPIVVELFGESPKVASATAFLIGFTSMNLLPLIGKGLVKKLTDNFPLSKKEKK